MATFFLGSRIAGATAGNDPLRVDRWCSAGEEEVLNGAALQQVAHEIGAGHFVVRNVRIDKLPERYRGTRLFAVYPVASPGLLRAPARQILLFRKGDEMIVKAGSAEEILTTLFSHSERSDTNEKLIMQALPEILSPLLFFDEGHWRSPQNVDEKSSTGDGRLDAVYAEDDVSRGGGNSLVWQSQYVHDNGGIEDIEVHFTPIAKRGVVLARHELHAPKSDVSLKQPDENLEEWFVAQEPVWRPPQRYRMMTMMAALGNASKQFQLATALLQETDDGAKAEGLKWLRASAAQGHQDAIDLLRQNGEELVRPDRDRDKVRLSRCCPVPGR